MSDVKYSNHFPQGFQFFGMGAVSQLKNTDTQERAYPVIVIFALSGEESGKCVVGFERRPQDISMSIEIANILASKLASNLCDDAGLTVEISPPVFLDTQEKQFTMYAAMLARESESAQRQYYRFDETVEGTVADAINIQLMFIPDQRGSA